MENIDSKNLEKEIKNDQELYSYFLERNVYFIVIKDISLWRKLSIFIKSPRNKKTTKRLLVEYIIAKT